MISPRAAGIAGSCTASCTAACAAAHWQPIGLRRAGPASLKLDSMDSFLFLHFFRGDGRWRITFLTAFRTPTAEMTARGCCIAHGACSVSCSPLDAQPSAGSHAACCRILGRAALIFHPPVSENSFNFVSCLFFDLFFRSRPQEYPFSSHLR